MVNRPASRCRCRVCTHPLLDEPLLNFDNMPALAQFLPEQQDIERDKGIELVVCQCSGCGLVQLCNEPVEYYREVIRAVGVSWEMTEFRQEQFRQLVEVYHLQDKKILEIGCGRGEYLSLMKQAGGDAYGIEFSEKSVAFCVAHGLPVEKCYLDSADVMLENGPFDAFFILNYLEHLPNINSVLSGIRNNLTDGAVGLVEVPNFDMILKKQLFTEFTTDHLFYFTAATLASTLAINGFDLVECRETWHDYIISAVVRKRAALDISRFNKEKEKMTQTLHGYIDKFGAGNVAVWGAGHQALAVLALGRLSGKIRYVVDSAPFKQGRFTPSTHIPIVEPERLATDPVAAVIVMAASYSDEVVNIIKKTHGDLMHVCVLRDLELESI